MSDLNELLETAETIRTNVLPESNTHELIGGHLKNIINYFESKKISTENIVSTTGLSTTKVVSQYGLTKSMNDKPGKVVDKKGEVFNAVDNNSAEGVNAHAEGFGNAANGEASHVEGIGNKADGYVSHAEGKNNKATNNAAHAEGFGNAANGDSSHAEGTGNTADGTVAHVEGRGNTASGNTAHVEGKENKGSGDPCHAEGYQTEASGAASHSEGKLTKASGPYAHAEGEGTIAQNTAEHACGRYNVSGGGVTIWSVGIGASDDDRKNAAEIRNDGKIYLVGLGGYDGTSAYGKKSVQEIISEAGSGSYIVHLSTPQETEEWAKSVFGDYTGTPENHPVYLAIKNKTPLEFVNIGVTSSIQYSATCAASIVNSKLTFILNYINGVNMYVVNISYTNGGTYKVSIIRTITLSTAPTIVQTTGYDDTVVMSQNAVTQAINSASVNSLHLKSGVPEETEEWSKYVFSTYSGDAAQHPVLLSLKEQRGIILYIHESPYNLIPASLSATTATSQVIFTLSYIFNNILYVIKSTYQTGGSYSTSIIQQINLAESGVANYVVNLTPTPTASAEWAKSVFGDYKGGYDYHPLYIAVKAGKPIQYSLNGDTNVNIAASVNVSIIDSSLSISLEYISSGRYYLVVTTYTGNGNYSVNIARNIDISSINDAITSLSSRIPTVVQKTGSSTTSVMSQDAVTKAIKSNGVFYKKLSVFNTTGSNPTNKEDIKLYLEEALLPQNGMSEFYNSTWNMAIITTVFSDSEIFITLKRKFGYQDTNYDFEVVQGIYRYVGLLRAGDSASVSYIYKVVLE